MTKDTLSPDVVERIIHLNSALAEAADWLAERAALTRIAYFAGGGVAWQPKIQWSTNHDIFDFELEAIVKCSIARDAPAFRPDDEYANLIAVVTDSLKHEDHPSWSDRDYPPLVNNPPDAGMLHYAEGLPPIEAFRQTSFCCLFHEIYDHTLCGDLDALLRIGEIEMQLILIRQRSLPLEPRLLPRKRKASYPQSVFSQKPCQAARNPLTCRELRYAHLLNHQMIEARGWIHEQTRRGEQEYLDLRGPSPGLAADNVFEDYEMMMEISGYLGENHPEYDEGDDNMVVACREPIYKSTERGFGRSGNIVHYDRYGCFFSPNKFLHDSALDKIKPCGLFWAIFEKTRRDWLKMLSIGHLWLDVFIMQRRVVQI